MIALGCAAAIAIAVLVIVLLGGDEDKLTPIAREACDELEGAIVLQAGGILERDLESRRCGPHGTRTWRSDARGMS